MKGFLPFPDVLIGPDPGSGRIARGLLWHLFFEGKAHFVATMVPVGRPMLHLTGAGFLRAPMLGPVIRATAE
jgi:hypothetical protein